MCLNHSIPTYQHLYLLKLPYRTGPQTSHARQMVEQNKECLIQISKYKFSLVISGLTKILQRVNESVISISLSPNTIVEIEV